MSLDSRGEIVPFTRFLERRQRLDRIIASIERIPTAADAGRLLIHQRQAPPKRPALGRILPFYDLPSGPSLSLLPHA
jgi:hypothetical protein